MAVRTNTLNGGNTYVDMDIQVVSADASQYTLRAVIYLKSLNVTDTSNNCSVTGQWGRSGTLSLGGVYNGTAMWSQDVSFPRTSVDQLIGWNLSWSGVEYWAGTLSGTAYYTVPAALQPPGAPTAAGVRNVTTTSAYTTGVSSTGSGHNNMWVQCNLPGGPIVCERTMGSWTDAYMDGLSPGTSYDFRLAAANAAGWSAWGPYTRFATAPAQLAAPGVTPTSGTTATATLVPTGSAIDQVVYRVYDSGGTSIIDYWSTLGTVPTSYVLTGLTPGASYTIGVFQHTSAGFSPESTRTAFTMPTVPGTPAAPTVSAITGTTATVSWVAPADGGLPITSYGVQVATDAAFSNVVIFQGTGALTGLTPGTPYWSRVRAGNAVGPGAYSTATPFTTPGGAGGFTISIGGVPKQAELWITVGGVPKLAELYVSAGGVPKLV